MIYSFKKNSGGGGTSDYSQLTNKPQINGVTLSGNKTSQDLGITSEALETVSSIPSGASVGDVYAIYSSREDYYGWDNLTGSTVVFHRGLNPDDGQDWAIGLGTIDLGDGYTRDFSLAFNDRESLNDQYGIVFIGGVGNYDYGKIHTVNLDNDVVLSLDLRDMQNFILSFEKNSEPYEVTITDPINAVYENTDIVNKTVQVETTYGKLGHFNYGSAYQGRYDLIMFWIEENGTTRFIPNSVIGQFHYYDIMFKLYTNANGFFNIDYSIDSAATWTNVYANMAPEEEPSYYPLDVTDPNGKNILFKAWLYPGDGNYGVKMKANKSMWIDSCDDPYGIVAKPMLKEGASYEMLGSKPSINGVELSGNKSTSDLGIELGGLNNPYSENLQSFTFSADGSDVSGQTGFIIVWDGASDIDFQAEAKRTYGWSGEQFLNTPYYSGGTWYNVSDWVNNNNTFTILPDGNVFIKCYAGSDRTYKFDGNYSGSTELKYIKSITSASTGALMAVEAYDDLKRVGVNISSVSDDFTITVSASTNDVITADYNINERMFTAATINGDSIEFDSSYSGYVALLSDGLTEVRIQSVNIILAEVGSDKYNPVYSKYAIVTGVVKQLPDAFSYEYIENPVEFKKDVYQFNGYTWDKLAKDYELPAPAVGETWVPFAASGFTYVRQDFNGAGQYGVECGGDAKSYVEITADGNLDYVTWGSKINLGNGVWVNTPLNGDLGYVYWWVKDGKVYTKVSSNKIIAAFKDDNIGTNPEGCLPF
jgi:hypothetical protein